MVAFLYLPHLTQSVVLVSFSAQPPPPPPPPPPKTQKYFFYYFIRFSFFVKIQNSLTRELTVIRVVGLPSPPPHVSPNYFFNRFSFGPVFTASTSPWQRPYGEGILLSYGRILPRLRCSCCRLFWTDFCIFVVCFEQYPRHLTSYLPSWWLKFFRGCNCNFLFLSLISMGYQNLL